MVNIAFPKLPNLNNFNFFLNPFNPYVITITAFIISGFSFLTYHYCFDKDKSADILPPPAPVVDDISIRVAKALLPPEDKLDKTYDDIETITHANINVTIPTEFDTRTAWPNCSEVIGKVWDQGTCQSCWAVSAASVMSDRVCIRSNGTHKPILSPQHLICSCKNCTIENDQKVPMSMCLGGDSGAAWKFWRDEGLVTGGDYGTNDSCLPYLAKPCLHNPQMPASDSLAQCGMGIGLYECPTKCNNTNNIIELDTKYKGAVIYYINGSESDIQKELMMYGPVQAKFTFDEKTLMHYTKGLFSCSGAKGEDPLHIHSVKIIGWGVQDDVPYWLCINSYNTHWGEQGTFKIQRGVNMCKIEESVMAGLPDKELWSRLGSNIS